MNAALVNGYRISTETVGRNFGVIGVVKYRNGRVAATTDTYPFAEGAIAAAEDLALALPSK